MGGCVRASYPCTDMMHGVVHGIDAEPSGTPRNRLQKRTNGGRPAASRRWQEGAGRGEGAVAASCTPPRLRSYPYLFFLVGVILNAPSGHQQIFVSKKKNLKNVILLQTAIRNYIMLFHFKNGTALVKAHARMLQTKQMECVQTRPGTERSNLQSADCHPVPMLPAALYKYVQN